MKDRIEDDWKTVLIDIDIILKIDHKFIFI